MRISSVLSAFVHPSRIRDWWHELRLKRTYSKIHYLHSEHASIVNAGERILGLEADQNARAHMQRYRFASQLMRGMSTVLDFACGTGYGSYTIAKDNPHSSIVGYDHDSGAIAFGQKHFARKNLQLTSKNPQTPSDGVTGFEYLEHTQDIMVAFDQLVGLTMKRLITSVPYMEPAGKNPHHVHSGLHEQSLQYPVPPTFYYQHFDGRIDQDRENVQNLIIVLDVRE